jgi:hypothetical protein
MTKKKTAILVLALAMCISIASAALLEYYAKIQTTVNVAQGILVDGQGYETPITETITGAGGKKLYTWHTITNLGDLPATVTFSSAIEPDGGVTVEYFENTAVLILENKEPIGTDHWTIIYDDTKAILTYNLIGKNFVYTLEAFGLKPETEYSLIYYADFDDRFSNWGGNNPGAVLGTFTTDAEGNIALTEGAIDLGMSLPSPPDANIAVYDYSSSPDYYNHAHGAKIWLVPNTDLTNGNSLPVINWEHHADWLYETDLITYTYLNRDYGLKTEPIREITIPAHSVASLVICITVDTAIDPATESYLVTTTVSPK